MSKTPIPRPTTATKTANTRSRVSNGRTLLAGADCRSARYRRFKDLVDAIVCDLGGAGSLSEMMMQDVRRAAGLAVAAEETEAKIVRGEGVNLTEHLAACNTLARIYRRLGYKKAAPHTPTLAEYLAVKAREKQEGAQA